MKRNVFVNLIIPFALMFGLFSSSNSQTVVARPMKSPQQGSVDVQQDWPVYGGQLANDHYSPLAQINKNNVSQLHIAWTYDSGEQGGLQTSPLVVGRVIYAYTPSQKVIALDGSSGKLK